MKPTQKTNGLRLLPGRFTVIEQAMGQTRNALSSAHEAVVAFITEMKANGFVPDSLANHTI